MIYSMTIPRAGAYAAFFVLQNRQSIGRFRFLLTAFPGSRSPKDFRRKLDVFDEY